MFYALGVRHFVLGVPNFHVPRCPFHIVSLPVLVAFVDCNDHHDGDNDRMVETYKKGVEDEKGIRGSSW